MHPLPVTVIILAAQRTGVTNPIAARAGVSHKCLAPICGDPLIAHVLETLTSLKDIREIRIVLESDSHAAIDSVIEPFKDRGIPLTLIASEPDLVGSVMNGTCGETGPFVITTADNVLLTPGAFDQIRKRMTQCDVTLGVATRASVWAAHEAGQRRFYEFRDDGYANCNIYGLANANALRTVEIFRDGGQFQKNKGRMVRAFGLFNIILFLGKLVSLKRGFARLGKRFGVTIDPVVFAEGSLAIDVDNERTYAICEWILGQRLGMDIPKPELRFDT